MSGIRTDPPLALLLNLEDRPDRLATALARCTTAGIHPAVHHATTPEQLRASGCTWDEALPPGQAACLASHFEMMDRLLASGAEYALILEDDVAFPDDFGRTYDDALASLTSDWDFVQLGWLPRADDLDLGRRIKAKVAMNTTVRRVAHAGKASIPITPPILQAALPSWGTHCYLVSTRFARRFVRLRSSHYWCPVDWLLRHYLETTWFSPAAPVAYRARFPLAGQDWNMGSDVDAARFEVQMDQMDSNGRVQRWRKTDSPGSKGRE